MKSSFRPLLAVLFLASAGAAAQGQTVRGFQDPTQPDCPSGQCPRLASAVQTVRDAASTVALGTVHAVSDLRVQHRQWSIAPVGLRVERQVTFVPGQPLRNVGRAVLSLVR